jgi:hypothetical protein
MQFTDVIDVTSYGDTAKADEALCKRVYDILDKAYPHHPWMIGVDHSATVGMVVIQLAYGMPDLPELRNKSLGFLLRISTVEGPQGEYRVRHAGGEMLERFGLPACGACDESAIRALLHGMITEGRV